MKMKSICRERHYIYYRGGRGQKIYCCEGFSAASGLSSREGRLEEKKSVWK